MIPVLKRLIRLKKQEVDIQRLTISDLEEHLNTLTESIHEIEIQLMHEQAILGHDIALAATFQHYADVMNQKKQRLREEHENIHLLYQAELSKLELLFGEMKTLETILDKKMLEAAHEKALKEQKEWDDKTMIAQNKRTQRKQ
ncbi:MAG: flagellar FliJ family protein [Candidatus Nucleicultricaceae bacterium]